MEQMRAGGTQDFAAMEIGELVTYQGRLCVLRGLEPMSIPDRRAHIEVVATGELLTVPLAELTQAPDFPAA